jgi:multidrug efflux pump subunit AcrA (membrane-fusion protein)
MNGSRYIRGLLVVALLGMGISQFIGRMPPVCGLALGQPRDPVAADANRIYLEVGVLEPVDCVDLHNEAGQPLPVLFIESAGRTVKKGQNGEATPPAAEETHLSEARIALLEAKMYAQTAQNKLRFLQSYLREQRVAELELTIARKESELARAQDAAGDAADRGRAAIAVGETNLRMTSDRLAHLEDQIATCKMYAPRDGTVVLPMDTPHNRPGEAGIKAGDTVGNHQTILRVADVSRLKVDIPVSARAAQRIVTGQPAVIRVDAIPDRAFEGRVATVLTASEDPSGSGKGRVTIALDNPSSALRPGMTAKVELDLSHK